MLAQLVSSEKDEILAKKYDYTLIKSEIGKQSALKDDLAR